MAYDQLNALGRVGTNSPLTSDDLRQRIEQLLQSKAQRYRRLWIYYRNPMLPRTIERDEQGSDRPYRQAQEWGLPWRLTGSRCTADISLSQPVDGVARKEIVIENDIAWRIDTMIDFLFGKPVSIASQAADPTKRSQIELLLGQILQHNGGTLLLQQLALLGAVYGFVDVLVKLDAATSGPSGDAGAASRQRDIVDEDHDVSLTSEAESAPRQVKQSSSGSSPLETSTDSGAGDWAPLEARLTSLAQMIRLEVVEPARALPVLSELNWRDVRAYVQVYRVPRRTPAAARLSSPKSSGGAKRGRWLSRVIQQLLPAVNPATIDDSVTVVEILTSNRWQRYEDEKLVAEGESSLGQIPLVHIQNLAVPFEYSGTSDVEQLIPLQDELNTRLCDRANRITMQSFKMYLGKGIDGFNEMPVAPGRMWVTDNEQADVIEFGGDPSSPSEDQHITELREAMDKISGVTPIAAGAIRDRIGNLTSAAALRVTLMALLAKTERKRSTYGQAIARMCELSLAWLDKAGLFHTTPDERRVEIRWPSLLPDSELEQLRQAQAKQSLGVPSDVLLRELGYALTPSPLAGEGRGEGESLQSEVDKDRK